MKCFSLSIGTAAVTRSVADAALLPEIPMCGSNEVLNTAAIMTTFITVFRQRRRHHRHHQQHGHQRMTLAWPAFVGLMRSSIVALIWKSRAKSPKVERHKPPEA